MDEEKVVEEVKEEAKEEPKIETPEIEKKGIFDMPDRTADFTPEDIQANKTIAILSYFGILVVVGIIKKDESPFIKFHANQALSTIIAAFVCGFISGLLSNIGFIGALIGSVITLVPTVLIIIGIVNAAQGKAKELPIFGNIKLLK